MTARYDWGAAWQGNGWMKVFRGKPDGEVLAGWTRVLPWMIYDLEAVACPLRRYTDELGEGQTGMVRAPKWAIALFRTWDKLGLHDALTRDVLKRTITYVAKTRDYEFAQAVDTVVRLQGVWAVEQMLREKRDLTL